MKIAILGAGAMGCLYGGMLAEAGHEVSLIDIWQAHIDALNRTGLEIETPNGVRHITRLRATRQPLDIGEVELVIVFVKATLTEQAMQSARSLVGKETVVLTLQNGLGNVEKLNAIVGETQVIAGTTGHGSTLLGAGKIRHAGVGDTILGEQNGVLSKRIHTLATLFNHAGMSTQISPNVMGLIWTKLIVNVGINALTALTGLKNGQLLHYPETEALMQVAIREACAVAQAKGVQLEVADLIEHTRHIAQKTAQNHSSMLQDVLAQRQTEISVINGAIVEEGKKFGVATPVNSVLSQLVLVKEKCYG